MGSNPPVRYKASVEKDVRRLDKGKARKLLHTLEQDLSKNPTCGFPLQGEYKGLFRHRIGDYRVIYTLAAGGVLVLRIGHRKDVYR